MDNAAVAQMMRNISWRLLPLLGLGYLVAYMDRVNISFAALQMNADLKFSATVYGIGGGLFFLSYACFEVPSNIFLARFGARKWLARIMISWGIIAAGMMAVRTPWQFYIMRFLLGMAEAGFFPGVVFYLAQWFPRRHRGRAISRFYLSGSVAMIVMGAMSGWLLALDGVAGLRGWQWLFLVQGLPATAIGLAFLLWLPDSPSRAAWLDPRERDWIIEALKVEAAAIREPAQHGLIDALRQPVVLRLGLFGFLTIGAFITFTLSVPLLLKQAAGLGPTAIGWIVAAGGMLGGIGILAGGAWSDQRGERFSIMILSTATVGLAYLAMALGLSSAIVTVGACLVFWGGWTSVTNANVMLWPDLLHPRQLAVGCAAINTMSQVGAFVMPILWGWARDATGEFRAGLFGLAAATGLALLTAVLLARRTNRSREDMPAALPIA